jgi:hypothetical protein
LHCSETFLRHLIDAAKAPIVDHTLARDGEISMRELARRGRAVVQNELAKKCEAKKRESLEQAQNGCKFICNWLNQEQLQGGWGEQIVAEARRLLMEAELNRKLPKHHEQPLGIPLEKIIEAARPPKGTHEDEESVPFFAHWLARWSFYAIPDSIIREKALALAIGEQCRM